MAASTVATGASGSVAERLTFADTLCMTNIATNRTFDAGHTGTGPATADAAWASAFSRFFAAGNSVTIAGVRLSASEINSITRDGTQADREARLNTLLRSHIGSTEHVDYQDFKRMVDDVMRANPGATNTNFAISAREARRAGIIDRPETIRDEARVVNYGADHRALHVRVTSAGVTAPTSTAGASTTGARATVRPVPVDAATLAAAEDVLTGLRANHAPADQITTTEASVGALTVNRAIDNAFAVASAHPDRMFDLSVGVGHAIGRPMPVQLSGAALCAILGAGRDDASRGAALMRALGPELQGETRADIALRGLYENLIGGTGHAPSIPDPQLREARALLTTETAGARARSRVTGTDEHLSAAHLDESLRDYANALGPNAYVAMRDDHTLTTHEMIFTAAQLQRIFASTDRAEQLAALSDTLQTTGEGRTVLENRGTAAFLGHLRRSLAGAYRTAAERAEGTLDFTPTDFAASHTNATALSLR